MEIKNKYCLLKVVLFAQVLHIVVKGTPTSQKSQTSSFSSINLAQSQQSFESSNNPDPGQRNDAVDGTINKDLEIKNTKQDYNWWGIEFTNSFEVRSFFIVLNETNQYTDQEKLIIGLVGDNKNNPCQQGTNKQCQTAYTSSWNQCTEPLQGLYFFLCVLDVNLHFSEVRIYSEYYVQQNYLSAALRSIYSTGSKSSSAFNALNTTSLQFNADALSASTTQIPKPSPNSEYEYLVIYMKAVSFITNLVVQQYDVPNYSTAPASYLVIDVRRQNNVLTRGILLYNSTSDLRYAEWKINQEIDTIVIYSKGTLSLSSVGIFSKCNCLQTSFEADLFQGNLMTPEYLTVYVPALQATEIYKTLYLNDTVGAVCTYSNGTDFCGDRSLSGQILKKPDLSTTGEYSIEPTTDTKYLVSQNSTSGKIIKLTIQPPQNTSTDVGQYTYQLYVTLQNQDSQFFRNLTIRVLQCWIDPPVLQLGSPSGNETDPLILNIGETKTIYITPSPFKNLTYFWDTRCGSNTYLHYQLSNITTTTNITYNGWQRLSTSNKTQINATEIGSYMYEFKMSNDSSSDNSTVVSSSTYLYYKVQANPLCTYIQFDNFEISPSQVNLTLGDSYSFNITVPSDNVTTYCSYPQCSGFCGSTCGSTTTCGSKKLYILNGTTSLQLQNTTQNLIYTFNYDNNGYVLTYDEIQNSVKIKPTKNGNFNFGFYYMFNQYNIKSVSTQLQVTVSLPAVLLENTAPQWVIKPLQSYLTVIGQELNLGFGLVDDQLDDFTIEINLGLADSFITYITTVSPGKGEIILFVFATSSTPLSTYPIQIKVTEIYNLLTNCTDPKIITQDFSVQVQNETKSSKSKNTSTNSTVVLVFNKTQTNKPKNIQPQYVLPSSEQKLVIKIVNITNLAVVTVIFNQKLIIDTKQMIVSYEQNSVELPIILNSWKNIKVEDYQIQLKLNFSRPLAVSSGDVSDKVIIQLPVMFENPQTHEVVITWFKLKGNLPLLFGSEAEQHKLERISDQFGNTSRSLFWIYLVCNILFSFALGMLWGTFQTLQVITAMPLLKVKMPANVIQVFKGFSDIVNMKIINSQQIYDLTIGRIRSQQSQTNSNDSSNQTDTGRLLRLLQDQSNTTAEESAGKLLNISYDNFVPDLILALLGITIFALILGIFIGIWCLIKRRCPTRPVWLHKLFRTIKGKLMWSSVLRYSTQSYLSTAITCMLSLRRSDEFNTFKYIMVPLTIVYLLVWPFILYKILKRNQENLGQDEVKASIGSLYMNYELEKSSVMTYTMWFLYRRLLFAIIIGMVDNVVFQMLLAIYSSVALLGYLVIWGPMEADHYDFLAVFNESVLCVSCYLMFLFTDYVTTPEDRYTFGNLFLYILYIDLAINVIMLVFEISRMIFRNCKRFWVHRRLKKQREIENKEKQNNNVILPVWEDQIESTPVELLNSKSVENIPDQLELKQNAKKKIKKSIIPAVQQQDISINTQIQEDRGGVTMQQDDISLQSFRVDEETKSIQMIAEKQQLSKYFGPIERTIQELQEQTRAEIQSKGQEMAIMNAKVERNLNQLIEQEKSKTRSESESDPYTFRKKSKPRA